LGLSFLLAFVTSRSYTDRFSPSILRFGFVMIWPQLFFATRWKLPLLGLLDLDPLNSLAAPPQSPSLFRRWRTASPFHGLHRYSAASPPLARFTSPCAEPSSPLRRHIPRHTLLFKAAFPSWSCPAISTLRLPTLAFPPQEFRRPLIQFFPLKRRDFGNPVACITMAPSSFPARKRKTDFWLPLGANYSFRDSPASSRR